MSNIELWNQAINALEVKDYPRARNLFESLQDNTEAQLQLGYLYQEGLGGSTDKQKAKSLFQGLADISHAHGSYFLAKLLLTENQLNTAVEYFEKSAQLKHVSGTFWTAALYGGYHGYPVNSEKHRYFLTEAAKLGHIYAKRDLALLDMRSNNSLHNKFFACGRYMKSLLAGIIIAVKDPFDFRIR
jgi:uncharacterized protein